VAVVASGNRDQGVMTYLKVRREMAADEKPKPACGGENIDVALAYVVM